MTNLIDRLWDASHYAEGAEGLIATAAEAMEELVSALKMARAAAMGKVRGSVLNEIDAALARVRGDT